MKDRKVFLKKRKLTESTPDLSPQSEWPKLKRFLS